MASRIDNESAPLVAVPAGTPPRKGLVVTRDGARAGAGGAWLGGGT